MEERTAPAPSGTSEPARPPAAALRWLADALLGSDPTDDVVVAGEVPPGYREVLRFVPFPSPRQPYALLPIDPRAAAETLRRIGNPSSKAKRFATSALAFGTRTGLPQRIRRDRVRFCVRNGDERPDLRHHLRSVLGRDDLEVGVILGRDRPNRKPVLKVIDAGGEPVAFAKLGWNDLSRRLVRREGEVLGELTANDRRPRSFDVPDVLHTGTWSGSELLVVGAAPREGWLRDGPPDRLPALATSELPSLDAEDVVLGDAPYWAGVRERIERAGADGLNPAADEVEARWGDREVATGRWHGDWIPWNMTVVDGRPFVWDWERSDTGVPAGIDAAHFEFDVRAKLRGEAPDRAVRECLRRAPTMLSRLGLAADLGPLLHRLHLIEMRLRFAEARAEGVMVPDAIYAPALDELLRGAG